MDSTCYIGSLPINPEFLESQPAPIFEELAVESFSNLLNVAIRVQLVKELEKK